MSLSYINSLFAITTKRKCPKEVEKVICTYILTIRGKKKIVQLLQFMPTMTQCEKWEEQAVNIKRSNDIRKKTEHFTKISKSYPYSFTLFQAPVPKYLYRKRETTRDKRIVEYVNERMKLHVLEKRHQIKSYLVKKANRIDYLEDDYFDDNYFDDDYLDNLRDDDKLTLEYFVDCFPLLL